MNNSDAEDMLLIERYRNGDTSAFEKIFKKYQLKVINILSMGGMRMEDASDAAQDIFLNLVSHLKKVEIITAFKPFLNKIIRNKLYDFYRKSQNSPFLVGNFDEPHPSHLSDGNLKIEDPRISEIEPDFVNHFEINEGLNFCLNKLPHERWKTILRLSIQGYKREQIAELLEIPLGSVFSALARAKQLLIECLKENNFYF